MLRPLASASSADENGVSPLLGKDEILPRKLPSEQRPTIGTSVRKGQPQANHLLQMSNEQLVSLLVQFHITCCILMASCSVDCRSAKRRQAQIATTSLQLRLAGWAPYHADEAEQRSHQLTAEQRIEEVL